MTTPDLAGLCERLTAYDHCSLYDGSDWEDVAREAAAAIERLVAALNAIADMCPATCETSLAHDMAQIACTALEGASDDR